MNKTILAIHAHPDDVEILAAGTLAQLSAAGHQVVIVSMTPGDCGSRDRGRAEIAAIRRQEAANAARLIGAAYRCAEFRDLAILNDDPSRRQVSSRCPICTRTSSPAARPSLGAASCLLPARNPRELSFLSIGNRCRPRRCLR